MRWSLNGYTLKYNPKSNSKNWSADEDIITNMNGNTSNPNLSYTGSQSFSIDIYDKPTYLSKTPIFYGSYISLSEQLSTGRLFLLRNNNSFTKITTGGVNEGTVSLTNGSTVLPSGNAIDMTYTSSGLAFLFKNSTQSIVVISDNSGVVNRKYMYDNQTEGSNNIISICWDTSQNIYMLNPYGKIFTLNIQTGELKFFHELDDFSSNSQSKNNRYSAIVVTEKNGFDFLGIVRDKNEMILIDETLNIVCKVEPRVNNVEDISFGMNSKKYHLIMGGNVYQMIPNTSRLDVEILKKSLSSGSVTIYDELGFPSVLVLESFNITRKRGLQEANYEMSITGDIAYSNQTFDSKWMKKTRGGGIIQ